MSRSLLTRFARRIDESGWADRVNGADLSVLVILHAIMIIPSFGDTTKLKKSLVRGTATPEDLRFPISSTKNPLNSFANN